MAELTELSSARHGNLKVVRNCALALAAKQHVMALRAVEVGKAVSSFPVFFTRNAHSGEWALSAVTSLEQGHNLFIENNEWTASYQPTSMQTYPLYLMRSATEEKSYTVGIDEHSDALSSEEGEALFDGNGKASLYLSRITALLEADINNDIQTYHFAKELEDFGLFKSVDVQVHYEDGSLHTLNGLHTLNEDTLQDLSPRTLKVLNKKGYLSPIYAMLISIFQLNSLIKKQNNVDHLNNIKQIKLEVSKDSSAA